MNTHRVKCPWCGRVVEVNRNGRLSSHVTPGNQRCIAIGQPRSIVESFNKLKEQRA